MNAARELHCIQIVSYCIWDGHRIGFVGCHRGHYTNIHSLVNVFDNNTYRNQIAEFYFPLPIELPHFWFWLWTMDRRPHKQNRFTSTGRLVLFHLHHSSSSLHFPLPCPNEHTIPKSTWPGDCLTFRTTTANDYFGFSFFFFFFSLFLPCSLFAIIISFPKINTGWFLNKNDSPFTMGKETYNPFANKMITGDCLGGKSK